VSPSLIVSSGFVWLNATSDTMRINGSNRGINM
jgi:hypothetical protein